MELMRLGGNRGIAAQNGFQTMEDVWNFVPWSRHHNWCEGATHKGVAVFAVLKDGDQIPLESSYHDSDGNEHTPDTFGDAETIGVQIANLDVNALIFHYEEYGQNGEEDWEEYLPVQDLDWGKMRRRVEDALRKTDDKSVLFSFAQKLNCKIS